MTSNRAIRRTHRWVSAVFAALVAVNIVSAAAGGPEWIGYLAIPPILVLLVTGIPMFLAPYRRRASRAAA